MTPDTTRARVCMGRGGRAVLPVLRARRKSEMTELGARRVVTEVVDHEPIRNVATLKDPSDSVNVLVPSIDRNAPVALELAALPFQAAGLDPCQTCVEPIAERGLDAHQPITLSSGTSSTGCHPVNGFVGASGNSRTSNVSAPARMRSPIFTSADGEQ